MKLSDGRRLSLDTIAAAGLPTIYVETKPPKPGKKAQKAPPDNAAHPSNPDSGVRDIVRQEAKKQINSRIDAQLNSRTYGLGSLVRGPNKKERLEDLLYSKLPYHPQFYRRGTRFDGVLAQPMDFGTAALDSDSLKRLGTEAPVE